MQATILEEARGRFARMTFLELSAFVRDIATARNVKISQLVGGRPTKANRMAAAINYEYSKNLQKAQEQAAESQKKAATLAKRRATIATRKQRAKEIKDYEDAVRAVKERADVKKARRQAKAEAIEYERAQVKIISIVVPDYEGRGVELAIPANAVNVEKINEREYIVNTNLRAVKVSTIKYINGFNPKITTNNLDDYTNGLIDRAICLWADKQTIKLTNKLKKSTTSPITSRIEFLDIRRKITGKPAYVKYNARGWENTTKSGTLIKRRANLVATTDIGSYEFKYMSLSPPMFHDLGNPNEEAGEDVSYWPTHVQKAVISIGGPIANPSYQLKGSYAFARKGSLNCIISATLEFLGPKDKKEFKKAHKTMRHGDAPYYLSGAQIDEIGKNYGICYKLYTELGYAANKHTLALGRARGTVVELLISNHHAIVLPSQDIMRVEYVADEDIKYYQLGGDNIRIKEDFATRISEPTPRGYESMLSTGFSRVLLPKSADDPDGARVFALRRVIRPSRITQNPADDYDTYFSSCTKAGQVFARHFVRTNGIKKPKQIYNPLIVRSATRAGIGQVGPICKEQIEIDQNANYQSYELNPFYVGFPHDSFITVSGPPNPAHIDEVAYVEVIGMEDIHPDAPTVRKNIIALCRKLDVLVGPLYKYLSQFFSFEVLTTTYANHKKYNILAELNRVGALLPPDEKNKYLKQLRNFVFGYLVQGGLKKRRQTITITEHDQFIRDLIDVDIQTNYPDAEINIDYAPASTDRFGRPVSEEWRIEVKYEEKAAAKYPHVYGYTLAYAKISVLQKLLDIQKFAAANDLPPPSSVKIDAIYIPKITFDKMPLPEFSIYNARDRYEFGEWKYQRGMHNVEKQAKGLVFTTETIAPPPIAPLLGLHILSCNIAAGGTGKTYNAIRDIPHPFGLFLSPTIELREGHRTQMVANGYTIEEAKRLAKCSQWLVFHNEKIKACRAEIKNIRETMAQLFKDANDKSPETMAAKKIYYNKMTSLHVCAKRFEAKLNDTFAQTQMVVIDEYTKMTLETIKTITEIARSYDSRIYLIGDPAQTLNELGTLPPSLENIHAAGFVSIHDPRNDRTPENAPNHRHGYEFGKFLDTLRGKSNQEIKELIAGRFKTVEEDEASILRAPIIAGRWGILQEYINKAKEELKGVEDAHPIQIKHNKTKKVISTSINDPRIWATKSKMTDIRPAGKTYDIQNIRTVDSTQGETMNNDIYIHFDSLDRHGALYTALTRTRTPEQITLLV